jgi:hypothetical protein
MLSDPRSSVWLWLLFSLVLGTLCGGLTTMCRDHSAPRSLPSASYERRLVSYQDGIPNGQGLARPTVFIAGELRLLRRAASARKEAQPGNLRRVTAAATTGPGKLFLSFLVTARCVPSFHSKCRTSMGGRTLPTLAQSHLCQRHAAASCAYGTAALRAWGGEVQQSRRHM